ncbi:MULTISPECIES: DUF5590 domain-containing protein [Streptococcus]|uniref:cell wall elongation regulator TseB-like domain-containing protein n=1 Tax=Streptococcus TaxID=1301 RepID=UPI0022844DA8|nr:MULTISPECIES: DUF5590 domain-containing protein [Streptococcus]MCY7024340.1 DUF5590 domain-containing protein [Streptococcus sanguinis]MDQ8693243.1 DUF5590 domain-containing protein [Streptococcus sp. IsoGale022]
MKYKNRNKASFPIWQYLIGIFIVLSVLVFSFFAVLQVSMQPRQSAKEASSRLAKEYADLEKVDSFAFYNGQESYYSLLGKTSKGVEKAVLIAKDSNEIRVYRLDQGVSQAEAKSIAKENGAGTIDNVTMGYFQDQPIWEVKSGGTYYLIGFENGQLVSKEGL